MQINLALNLDLDRENINASLFPESSFVRCLKNFQFRDGIIFEDSMSL